MRWLTLAITIWKFIFQFNTFEDQAEINFYSFLFMYPFNINAPTKLNVLMDSEILMCLIGSGEMCEAAALKMLPRYFSIVSSLLHDIIGLVVKTKSGSWTIHTVRFNKPHRKLSIMLSTFTEHFPSDKRLENILLPRYRNKTISRTYFQPPKSASNGSLAGLSALWSSLVVVSHD